MKLKTHHILLPMALLPFAFSGCSDRSQDQAETAYENTTEAVQDSARTAGDSLAQTWEEVADFSVDQKDKFVSSMEGTYANLKSKAEGIKNKSGDISDDAVDKFDSASKTFQEQLDKAGDASANTWDSTKNGVSKAWNNLVDAYDDLEAEATGS